MNRERWQRLESIFLTALRMPADERDAWVQRECAGDEELLREVRRMLAVGLPRAGFIEPPPRQERAFEIPPLRRLGEFELLQEIGRGGMGIVFRAWQPSLNRTVAVKVLPGGFSFSPARVDRFVREARAVAKLVHPGIVTIHSVGVEGDTHYFAMEYVQGVDLGQELRRQQQHLPTPTGSGSSSLPDSRADSYFRRIAEVARDVADALHHAHQNGIVHRDVKPSNLLIDRKGHVKVVDFGLARDESQGSVTKSGELAGTPYYMSPEQVRAKKHQVDHRTDVYSLGVVLFELLTLRRPFEGKSSEEVVRSILEKEAPGIRKLNHRVPRDLAVICQTAMAKDVRRRYANAAALRGDLERFLSHQAIEAKAPSVWERALRQARRHERALVTAAVAIAAVWITAGWTVTRARQGRLDEHLDAVRAATTESLESLPLARLVDLTHHVAALEADGSGARVVRDARAGLEKLKERWRQDGLADLARARDEGLAESQREESRLRGLRTLIDASFLFPDDVELRRLASIESAYPTLAVTATDASGNAVPATVFVRDVDSMTSGVGPKRRLGRTPLPPTPIVPGVYRVVVVFDDGGFREAPCTPGPALMTNELAFTRRQEEDDLTDGMVLIEGGEYVIPEYRGGLCLTGARVALEAYWIDECEVSNRDYARFCRESGTPEPYFWDEIGDREEFLRDYGDLPVTGIEWHEAVAYALWRGARLPTFAEWSRAATGLEGRDVPWIAPSADEPLRGNVHQPSRWDGVGRLRSNLEIYLRSAAPVRTFEDARSPEGLYHLYGNVAELTESLAVIPTRKEGGCVPRLWERFRCGGSWNAATEREPMRNIAFIGTGNLWPRTYIGFRCARSAAP